jgi:hypothetical protein
MRLPPDLSYAGLEEMISLARENEAKVGAQSAAGSAAPKHEPAHPPEHRLRFVAAPHEDGDADFAESASRAPMATPPAASAISRPGAHAANLGIAVARERFAPSPEPRGRLAPQEQIQMSLFGSPEVALRDDSAKNGFAIGPTRPNRVVTKPFEIIPQDSASTAPLAMPQLTVGEAGIAVPENGSSRGRRIIMLAGIFLVLLLILAGAWAIRAHG